MCEGIQEYLKPDNLPEVCVFAEICKRYKKSKPTCNRQESKTFCGYHKRIMHLLKDRRMI